jgi:O-methyltransferase involved in polyketide biosynthesis
MTDKIPAEALSAVSETMLATLYSHAEESRRSDALIRDPRAEEMVARIDYDFVRSQMGEDDQAATCLRLRQFDRFAQVFLAAHPDGVVVHIGCGLDTRFDRVDNGQVTWYDLDLPPVIELRRKLLEETPRYRMIATSALDLAWLDVVDVHPGKPFLFIAEGVFMYFPDAEMRRLVSALRERFPGAEMVFDVASPLVVALQNLSLARMKADFRMRWSLRHYDALEAWASGIQLLETWYYTSIKESVPRLQKLQTIFRLFPPLGKGTVILHYRLNHTLAQMEERPMKNKSTVWGYGIAALVGAVAGGLAVALAARLAPKVMGRMMDKMMAEFPRRMMARMQAEGRDPMEMCQKMMAEFGTQEQKETL